MITEPIYDCDAQAPFVLKVYQPGQTHPVPFVTYRDSDMARVERIAHFWIVENCTIKVIDNTADNSWADYLATLSLKELRWRQQILREQFGAPMVITEAGMARMQAYESALQVAVDRVAFAN